MYRFVAMCVARVCFATKLLDLTACVSSCVRSCVVSGLSWENIAIAGVLLGGDNDDDEGGTAM